MKVVMKVTTAICYHILSDSFVTAFLLPTSGLNIFARNNVGPGNRLPGARDTDRGGQRRGTSDRHD